MPSETVRWRLLPWFVAACALALYASTSAPWLTWANDGGDGGDLIAATMTWGVPHPSGYPTYCLLARAYAVLPLGPIAHRFNLFSATATAGTAIIVYLWVVTILDRLPTQNRWYDTGIALLVSLACITAPTLWSQATITEVYSLNALFFCLILFGAWRIGPQTSTRGWAILGLGLGLGLGAHLTLFFAVPALAILLVPHCTPKRVLAALAGTLLGLCVYAYLPLAALSDPPINWGNPRTWNGFWWVVSGRLYHGYALALPLRYLPMRLGAWFQLTAKQYTWLGLALAMNGLWSWIEEGRTRWVWATAATFFAYAAYAITYDTVDSYVYLIPSHLITVLWMGEGARSLLSATTRAARYAATLVFALLLAIPLSSLVRHMPTLNLNQDRAAAQWTARVLDQLPTGALVITGEDNHTFALDYVRWVERRREDLSIVDGELLQQRWYVEQLPKRYPTLALPPAPVSLEALISANLAQRPVFLTNRRDPLEVIYAIESRGPALWAITAEK